MNDRFVDIIEEGYDIAIRIGKLEDSTLIARQLGDYRLTICASPEYLAANGTPEKPQDLASHKCLGFTLWRNQSGWRAFLSQLSSSPMTRLESNNVAALHIAAKNGIGLLLIPRNLVEEDIKAKKLIEILPSYLPTACRLTRFILRVARPLPSSSPSLTSCKPTINSSYTSLELLSWLPLPTFFPI